VQEGVPEAHLTVYGANLEVLPEAQRKVYVDAIQGAGDNVTFAGPYDPSILPRLMAEIDWVIVPSRWWENSPLVIQEAFMHGRPVICTGIGGMAEKVTNGVNGLHFFMSDRAHLADTIRRAVRTPGLWEHLRAGIPPVYTMDEHIASLSTLYEDLIARRARMETAPALEEAG
jgi:glycosyltransferase involved in cell wall biosynthesis